MKPLDMAGTEMTWEGAVAENVARLRESFPDVWRDGKLDFDVLKHLLGDAVDDGDEKFGLNWHGKRKARQLALTPSTGTLLPCTEESVAWATTQNIVIEGDNLEVLKLLQKSYSGRAKVIYIDPPYNTGNDFVYPDDFSEGIENYLTLTGQADAGRRTTTNAESAGRFHTTWLNMLYPRLKLARSLLSADGAIFISTDDHEVHNLRAICNEIFGEENFVATIIWQKIFSPKNSAQFFSEDHDYIVVYARNTDVWRPRLLPRTDEMEARYSNPDGDPRGVWTSGDLSARNYYGEGTYSLVTPSGRIIGGPPPGRYWAISKPKFDELNTDGRIWWGEGQDNMPRLKRFLTDVRAGKVPQTLWFHEDVGHTQESKKELLEALPFSRSEDVFETPKPTRLIRRILQVATDPASTDLVIDFFAGSGTTGHAVLAQNAEDGGKRRFLCVQLPSVLERPAELADGTVLHTLADITKQRIARAAARIQSETPMLEGDFGFRVFRLASSNVNAWNPPPDGIEQTLLQSVEHLRNDRTDADILWELLIKRGFDLAAPVVMTSMAGKDVYCVGETMLACLARDISRADVEPLAQAIVAWYGERNSAAEVTCVFRDSAFADDVAKANLTAILEQYGVSNVRSL
jgi:adenine-specific DNA-methyltransferase